MNKQLEQVLITMLEEAELIIEDDSASENMKELARELIIEIRKVFNQNHRHI